MDENGLIGELKKVIADGVSQAKVAADLGVSSALLSQWIKGKYTGDNDKMNAGVSGFLARRRKVERQEILFYPKDVVETTMTNLVRSAAIGAYREGEIAVIYGNAGSGKTSGIKAFAYQNQGTIVVTANVGYTAKVLFQELAENLDLSTKGSVYDIFTRIKAKLKGVQKTVIIDEAEHLPYRALDLLRSLQDDAKFGLVLVGLPRLLYNLKGNKSEYAQLYSRISVAYKAPEMSKSDAERVLSLVGIDKANALICATETSGNIRSAVKLAKNAKNIAEKNDRAIDKELIAAAKSLLVA
jgi:DNA transposition AAA+ family ATPase